MILGEAEIYVIGGWGSSRVMRLSVDGDGEVGRLPDAARLPCKELWHASVVVDDSETVLYVTGGVAWMSDGHHYDQVWRLDTREEQPDWTRHSTLVTGRLRHCSFRLGSQLFVCGGLDEHDNVLDTVEVLTDSHRWKHIGRYPIKVNITTLLSMSV